MNKMVSNDGEKQYNLTGFQFGVAGASSGVVTRFLLQPLDVLKIRFQLQTTSARSERKYRSIFQSVRVIIKEEGVPGLWKGHIPAQYLSIVFGAVQFSTYEILSSYYHNNYNYRFSGVDHLVNIGAGSVAGLAAVVTSFPFDVMKTHLVFQREPKVYKGTLDVIRCIYKKEGIIGFGKGMVPACIQTALTSGLLFLFHGVFTEFWLLAFNNIDSKKSSNLSTFGSMVCGLLAGFSAKTVIYPFDLMKKRLQIQSFDGNTEYSKEMIKCRNMRKCVLLTLKNEGFFGLFKGFYPSLIKAGVTTSIYFTVYDKVCQLLEYLGR